MGRLTGFLLCGLLIAAPFAQGVEWGGGYRMEAQYLNGRVPAVEEFNDKGDPRLKKPSELYALHQLYLQPRFVVGDSLFLQGSFHFLNRSSMAYPRANWGQVFGSSFGQERFWQDILRVPQAYVRWSFANSQLSMGRLPLDFGLGLSYSHEAAQPFAYWLSAVDGVQYEISFGSMTLRPLLGLDAHKLPGQSDDGGLGRNIGQRLVYMLGASYEGQGFDVDFLYERRPYAPEFYRHSGVFKPVRGSWGADSTPGSDGAIGEGDTPTPHPIDDGSTSPDKGGGTKDPATDTAKERPGTGVAKGGPVDSGGKLGLKAERSYYSNWSVYYSTYLGEWLKSQGVYLGVEGSYSTQAEERALAVAGDLSVEWETWDFGLRGGYVSGASGVGKRAYYAHPNYGVGMLLFKKRGAAEVGDMGEVDEFGEDAVTAQALDVGQVHNAFYAELSGGKVLWRDLRLSAYVASAMGTGGVGYWGTEAGLGLDYSVGERVRLGAQAAYMFTGDASRRVLGLQKQGLLGVNTWLSVAF